MRFAPPLKLALHSQFAGVVQRKKVYPINVEISPSGICNASCDFCFYANTGELGEHRKVFLGTEVVWDLLTHCPQLGVKSISWTGGGDPSLHPQIGSFVDWTHMRGLKQGMFTNALAKPKYNPTLLDWIRITMTNRPYNRGYIEELRRAKTLGFAFNYAGPQDDAYLYQTLELAEQVEADYVQVRPALKFHGKTVDIAPPKIVHPLLHVTEYKFEDAKHKHGYATCEAYHLTPFVWEDGNVDVCSYMRKYEGYRLGNLYQDNLQTILDRAPSSVPVHENCQVCCKLHETNKVIHQARQLEDVDFP